MPSMSLFKRKLWCASDDFTLFASVITASEVACAIFVTVEASDLIFGTTKGSCSERKLATIYT